MYCCLLRRTPHHLQHPDSARPPWGERPDQVLHPEYATPRPNSECSGEGSSGWGSTLRAGPAVSAHWRPPGSQGAPLRLLCSVLPRKGNRTGMAPLSEQAGLTYLQVRGTEGKDAQCLPAPGFKASPWQKLTQSAVQTANPFLYLPQSAFPAWGPRRTSPAPFTKFSLPKVPVRSPSPPRRPGLRAQLKPPE